MRELKFRAWDKSNHTMLHFANPQISYGDGRTKLVFGENFHDDFYESKIDAPLMQFTGMCDQTGQEIYEGDIVCLEADARRGETVCQVVYFNGAFYYENEEIREDMATEMSPKVLGNIYEQESKQ